MDATKVELEKVFAAKTPQLIAELEAWFEKETASIDGKVAAGADVVGLRLLGSLGGVGGHRGVGGREIKRGPVRGAVRGVW